MVLTRLPYAAVAAATLSITSACSDFLLNSSFPSNVISARSMDFEADLKTVVEVIPRGTTFQELPVYDCVECADYQWTSKYGFVAFNMFGLNAASDGLNEKGLSAAWLYLDGTVYPTPAEKTAKDPSKPIVTSVCTYLLGNYATVDEVREGLKTFQIAEFDERIEVPVLHDTSLGRVPLHVSVHDASGKNLVIEFVNGQTKVYDNVHDVLTNDPPLNEQLEALKANGFKHIPGGYGSTERFLRIAVLNYHAPLGYSNAGKDSSYIVATEEQRGVSDALHIINTVVRTPLSEATEWTVVRDHGRRKIYIRSTQNLVLRMIDLNKLDFANPSSRHLVPVTVGDWAVDITGALQDPSNTAKTMDLPPRTQIEQLIEKLVHGGGGGAPPAPATLSASKSVTMPSSSTGGGFVMGSVVGALVAVAAMAVMKAVTNTRRYHYQRIRDPEEGI